VTSHHTAPVPKPIPKTATVDIHTSRKHGVKSYLKGLSGPHPSALPQQDVVTVKYVKPGPLELPAERVDGAPRKDCGEEGVLTNMASCDVLMPPRRHEEISLQMVKRKK